MVYVEEFVFKSKLFFFFILFFSFAKVLLFLPFSCINM
jgi:hypothetical protein